MAMPQRDNYIEQIRRLEGLIAYAEEQQDWEELERLKEQLRKLMEVSKKLLVRPLCLRPRFDTLLPSQPPRLSCRKA